MLYILKIKGTKTIPDFVQIRDKDLTLIAYFRLSQVKKGLQKKQPRKGTRRYNKTIRKNSIWKDT